MASPPDGPHAIEGVRLGAASAGIRYRDRDDLALIELADGTRCAAVFTRNAFCAAPVIVAREHLEAESPRYLLINSGNANAGTGRQGLADARAACAALAAETGCADTAVLPFSTGVIGEPLPVDRLARGLPAALASLSEDGWERAARAIMTTDTHPKIASARADLGGTTITVTGIAKGAGMICPDMATMLAYLATDAAVDANALESCLGVSVEESFNAVTVDGDTSTNDACVLVATGRAGNPEIGLDDPCYPRLLTLAGKVCDALAEGLIRDAEGATKFIAIRVAGGRSREECRRVAYAIAHSPLVMTAFYASDPNWGRILAAVGRSRVAELDIDRVQIFLDDLCIVRDGCRAADYTEEHGQAVMDRDDISVTIALGRGDAEARVRTSDLSVEYVKINADYRS